MIINLSTQLGVFQRSRRRDDGTPVPRPGLGSKVLLGKVTLPFSGVEGKICGLYHRHVHVVSKVATQRFYTELDSWSRPLVGYFVFVHVQIVPPYLQQPGVNF